MVPTDTEAVEHRAPQGASAPRARIVRAAMTLMAGHGVRVAVQGALFVLLARELGVQAYGGYAAVAATSAILMPLVALGLPLVMVRDVVRAPHTAQVAWSELVRLTLASGAALVAIGVTIMQLAGITVGSVATIAMLMLADTVCLRLNEAVGLLWQARGRALLLAVLPSVVQGLRLIALLVLLTTGAAISLDVFAIYYLLAAAVPAAASVAWTSRALGGLDLRPQRLNWSRIRTGLTFSTGTGAATVNNDLDKTLLASTVSATTAGLYSAGYRVIDMVYVPVRALIAALYPTLVHEGGHGPRGSSLVARRIAPWIAVYGVSAAIALLLLAGPVTALLGEQYADTEGVIKALAVVLVLRGLSTLACDAITGADRNRVRMAIQVTAAVINVALNVALIPVLGMYGAALATLISETFLAVTSWVVLLRLAATSTTSSAPATTTERLA